MNIPVALVLVSVTGFLIWQIAVDPFGINQPYRKERTRFFLPNGDRLELVTIFQSGACFPQVERFLADYGYTVLSLSEFEKLFSKNLFSLSSNEAYIVYESGGDRKGIWEITIETYSHENNREVDFKMRKIDHFEDIQFTKVCIKRTVTMNSKIPEKVTA